MIRDMTVRIRMKWWVPLYLLAAKAFIVTMGPALDEEHFIETASEFIAQHGLKLEIL